ncbi:MAG TPA: GcrA cell cycle regulator, partial [Candidatus Hydrogenedentes bacterium]|nr:GcrA cell cycle regulator [Candidatus Hydrogenedentota bacterium]
KRIAAAPATQRPALAGPQKPQPPAKPAPKPAPPARRRKDKPAAKPDDVVRPEEVIPLDDDDLKDF